MCLVRKHSIIDSIHVLLLNCGVYLQWKQNINTDFEYIIFIIVLLTVLFRLNAFITEINLRHLVQNYRTDIFLILISFWLRFSGTDAFADLFLELRIFRCLFIVGGGFVGAIGRSANLHGSFKNSYIDWTRSISCLEYFCAVRSNVEGVLMQSSPPNSQTL